MAQINLLKQKTSIETVWHTVASVLVKLLMLLVLVLLGFYGWQFVKIGGIDKKTAAAQQAINQAQQTGSSVSNRDELYTRQAQLQQFDSLISKHLYWSNLFPALAKVTLKQSSFSSLTATQDGQMDIAVSVPDLSTVDKFLQVFDQPEFNANFYNLRIGTVEKAVAGGQTVYNFDAKFNFNPSLLQYQTPAKSSGR